MIANSLFRDVSLNVDINTGHRDCGSVWQDAKNRFPHPESEDLRYRSLARIREGVSNCPIDGNNGKWEGERGDGRWIPEDESIPLKHNPEERTWEEIKEEYEFEGADFTDGDLNLESISKGTVEIDEITESRSDNFDQADMALAEKRGCTPEDVAQWRKDNSYTWHERADGNTMQKVPSIIHGNISHRGGVAVARNNAREAAQNA